MPAYILVVSNSFPLLQKFYQGLSVACRSWIGVVHDVLLKLTLKLKNGARYSLFILNIYSLFCFDPV